MKYQTMTREDVMEFIELCNKTWGKYPDFSGGCYKFSKLLISVFGGEMYWSHDHIITVIDGTAYDINGTTKLSRGFIKVGSEGCPEEYIEKVYREYV